MKTHQVQQKTERRISAALRLVFVAALLLGQIALAFFLSAELRQRAAIIYTCSPWRERFEAVPVAWSFPATTSFC